MAKLAEDEVKLNRDITRKAQVEALLRNDLLVEAFDTVERSYFEGWRATKLNEDAAREKLWIAANVIRIVRAHLGKVMDDGKLAQAELEQIAQMGERRKLFGYG